MDPRFDDIFTHPENEIFRVVFFPDRIYHARYLNATRSSRYRYNVTEVRGGANTNVVKGEVYLDGLPLCGMLRIEYDGGRLVELARQHGRQLGPRTKAWVRVMPTDPARHAEAILTLHWDPFIDAYAVEVWETLEAPEGRNHDHKVLGLMGRHSPITRVRGFSPALSDLRSLAEVAMAFREDDKVHPTGQAVQPPEWDNDYRRSHQEPRTSEPSADANTILDQNYLMNFQRGFFIADAAQVAPVRYRNAMSDPDNPDRFDDNIIEMRWLLQRELGGNLVFFHEVTIPPGCVEGAHRHIGSEELYYVVSGSGIAYMSERDDPATSSYPLVERPVFGLDRLPCRELPVKAGSVIYTKSGGVHGIRNPGAEPLKFVAFLYQTI